MALAENPGHLKVELSLRGLKLAAGLRDRLFEGGDPRASRDIDLLLPEDVWVQAPIDERWTTGSPFTLADEAGRFRLRRADDTRTAPPLEVRVLAPPEFYRRQTGQGTPMGRVAEVHGNFVAIDPVAACGFGIRGLPCPFCRGVEPAAASTLPSVADVIEVVRAAFDEGAAEFVYFRARCSDAPDGGFGLLRPYILAVKKHFDTLVAAELDPPADQRDVDRTYAAGVDAVSYSFEIYDPEVLARHCPRRAERGRDRYLEALRHAATIFPAGTVWTELIVGIEPLASTRAAIERLAAMGVLPVLSVVGPAAAAAAPDLTPPRPEDVRPIYAHLYEAVKRQRTPMTWVRDLPVGMTPLDARFFVDESARVPVTSFYRSRLGTLAARSLSRLRRRLRVKTVSESFDSSRL